jgi:KaiC/GvpD/RAD55 family RecA-like ATPase
MLISALVAALTVTPSNVLGQGYVTVTTQATTTALYTYPVTTRSVTTTETIYIYGPQDFSVNVCGEHPGIWGDHFHAFQGQRYRVNWTSKANVSLDLYITTYFPGALSNSGPGCETFPASEVIYSYRGATGSVDWVAPSTGQFIIWFLNPNLPTAGTFSIETLNPTTFSTTSYGSASTVEPVILTTIISQTNLNISQIGIPFANLGLFGAVVAIAVVAGVLVIARRRKTSVAATLVQERPVTVLESPKVAVAPQAVTPTKTTQPQPVISEIPPIISTGYADLDRALNGGIPEEFAVVIVSPSFDERDLLLRKVVNSALSSGRLAILISNDMGRTKDMASRYPNGFYALSPQADRISQHGPNLLKIPSIENLSDANISLGLVLKDVLAKEKATKRIIIIDILSDLLLRYKSILTRRWLTDFVGKRKAEGFTIIATLNPLTTTKEETQNIIDFFDGVIEIFEKPLMERSRRFLMIRKMYGQKYSDSEVLMDRDKLF